MIKSTLGFARLLAGTLIVWKLATACTSSAYFVNDGAGGAGGRSTGGAGGESNGGALAGADAGEPEGGMAGDAGASAGSSTVSGAAGDSSAGASEAGAPVGGQNTAGAGEPSDECVDDNDCVLARNAGQCCSACDDAFLRDELNDDPCLVPRGQPVPATCSPGDCSDVRCSVADIACEQPLMAVCEDGQCSAVFECPDGLLQSGSGCVPPCQDNSDCVVARPSGGCCNACLTAVNAFQLTQEACLIEAGESVPEECQPDPDQCMLVACPAIICLTDPGVVACMGDGLCGFL